MTDRLKRITREACEEIAREQGIRHWDAVLTHPKLRRLAYERIDEKMREENEPKMPVVELDPGPEGNGSETVIEMALEFFEEEEEEEPGS